MSFSILSFEPPANEAEPASSSAAGLNVLNDNDALLRNPCERMGHVCVTVASRYMVIWGGHRYDDSRNERVLDPRRLWIFDCEAESWRSLRCLNEENDENVPPLLSGTSAVNVGEKIYLFGGSRRSAYDGFTDLHFNDLFEFNLKTLKWTKCPVKGDWQPSPRDKSAGWHHDNKLFYFGGFGPAISGKNDPSQFVEISNYSRRLGWNNQLVSYDLASCTWQNHEYYARSANVPKPRAAHSCIKMNDRQVVLFGGRTIEERTDDLFILDMTTLTWSENLSRKLSGKKEAADGSGAKRAAPLGRSWHTLTRIDAQNLFLYGGLSQDDDALGDGWILNVPKLAWTKIETRFESRLWHSASFASMNGQIYIFGGSSNDVYINQPKFPKHMLKISLSPESLQKKCIGVICASLVDKYDDKDLRNQVPSHLEALIFAKYLSKTGGAALRALDSSGSGSSLSQLPAIPRSRSEYCSIS